MDEEVRGVRSRKRIADPTCCPVCGVTVRTNEMDQHYALEMDRLNKLSKKSKITNSTSPRQRDSSSGCNNLPTGSSTNDARSSNGTTNSDEKDCWSAYQRIKNNRSARLKVQVRNKKRRVDDPICPVCNKPIPGDINVHVESCLQRSEEESRGSGTNGTHSDEDEDDSIDVEGETFEEYEWAGQTRIRASSLLEGGYSATGLVTAITNASPNVDDEDLNVDGDDSQIYGSPQYTERDIIVPLAEENTKENLYLRNLVLAQTACVTAESSTTPSRASRSERNDQTHAETNVELSTRISEPSCSTTTSRSDNVSVETHNSTEKAETTTIDSSETYLHIIDALKTKIREYEIVIQNKSKCLICMDDFRAPVVSICCWHVHCEECWLRTLGARKLCPQCNMITSATDLRRIYM